jgi:hypothetical protein
MLPSRVAAFHASVPHRVRGGLEERLIEPGLDWILCLVVAVCVSGAHECCGALGVAVHHGDGGQATEAFKRHRLDDHVATEREFLAERLRSGVGLTGQQRSQAKIAAVDHPYGPTVQRARDRSRAGSEVRCVTIAAETERGIGRVGEQVRELMDVADVAEQRGGPVDALAQFGDVGRRNCLSARRFGDLPLVAGSSGPVKRLVGEGVGGIEPLGVELVIDA